MESSSLMNLGERRDDPNFIAYQNYTSSHFQVNDNLASLIKNRDIFEKAQKHTAHKTDWYSEFKEAKKKKNGLTQEQEIQIGLEMIPMFKAKEEEAVN